MSTALKYKYGKV